MSVLVSSSDQINRCPLNNSQAKALYSFQKEERFKTFYKLAHPNKNHQYFISSQYEKLSTLQKT